MDRINRLTRYFNQLAANKLPEIDYKEVSHHNKIHRSPSIDQALLRIKIDPDLQKSLNDSLKRRSLDPFLKTLEDKKLNETNFISAAILFLLESKHPNKASLLTELLLFSVDPNEEKVNLSDDSWGCPSAYGAYLILEKTSYHLGFPQTNFSPLIKNLLPDLNTTQGKELHSKIARSLEAVSREKDFNCMANDLAGYYKIPRHWIYNLRESAKKLSFKEIRDSINEYLNPRNSTVPPAVANKVYSLIQRELSVYTNN